MMFDEKNSVDIGDAELEQVLQDFRENVHAWSDAEYSRPRSMAAVAVRRTWRLATAWALGCVLAFGGLSTGIYARHHQQNLARIAAERQAQERQRAEALAAATAPMEQLAKVQTPEEDENLMSVVDRDVSRQVPSAMEPLAQLMDSSTVQ